MVRRSAISLFAAGAAVSFIGIVILLLTYKPPSSTNDLFLIPAGFEGTVRVTYNVPGAPELRKEGRYDIIPVRPDGTFETSTPDMEYGMVTNQYFYVDEAGRRTPIDEKCVAAPSNGASEVGGKVTRHVTFDIKQTGCSEDL